WDDFYAKWDQKWNDLHRDYNDGEITYQDYIQKQNEYSAEQEAESKTIQAQSDAEYKEYIVLNNAYNKAYSEAEVKAFNEHFEFVALNTKNKTKLATMKFQQVEEKYEWEEGIENYDYYSEPILIFGDKSQSSFEDYADKGFGELINDIEKL